MLARDGASHTRDAHYFFSSIGEWHVGINFDELRAQFDRHGLSYVVWFVPLPPEAPYKIENFAPQVKGAVMIGRVDLQGVWS